MDIARHVQLRDNGNHKTHDRRGLLLSRRPAVGGTDVRATSKRLYLKRGGGEGLEDGASR